MKIDSNLWLDFLKARRRETTHPRHGFMIDQVIHHLDAEFKNDLEGTMATLMPDTVFHAWAGMLDRDGPFANSDIREGYRGVMEQPGGFPPNRLDVERFYVGDDGVCMEGVLGQVLSGADLAAMGEPVDPAKRYSVYWRHVNIISFRGELMVGEDLYWDPRATIEEFKPD